MRHIRDSRAEEFAAGTEARMLYRLRHEAPFEFSRPVNSDVPDAWMKTITLERVRESLEALEPPIRVPEGIARRAQRALGRALEIV